MFKSDVLLEELRVFKSDVLLELRVFTSDVLLEELRVFKSDVLLEEFKLCFFHTECWRS